MLRARHIPEALRVASLWLVVLAVLSGPLGVGAAFASSGAEPCGVSCPCDQARHTDPGTIDSNHNDEGVHAAGGKVDGAVAAEVHRDPGACGDGCPDGCPDCGCCLRLAAGVVSPLAWTPPGSISVENPIPPLDAPAAGTVSGVFRPPRSRA